MDFNFFAQRIPKIKNLPLPGEVSHYKMMPAYRMEELKSYRTIRKDAKQAGVMALCYPDANRNTYLLLILRKTYKGVHSNQIGFPGGRAESYDDTILATALREMEEEVGVASPSVEVVKGLTSLYIPPSNFEVHPFLGICRTTPSFNIQDDEVEALVRVRLTDFLDDANIFHDKMNTSYAKNVAVPAFLLNGYTVWGATAMMLSEIKTLLQKVL